MTSGHQPDRRLRIVLAVGSLMVGGTEKQVLKLAVALRARGHDVHLVALCRGGPLEGAVRSAGVPLTVFGHRGLRPPDGLGRRAPAALLREVRVLLAVRRHLRLLRPDVCHAFLFTCNTRVLPLAWSAGVPVRISGRRGDPPPVPTGTVRRILDFLGDHAASAFLCNARAVARRLADESRVPPGRVRVIPNAVDIPPTAADVGRAPPKGVVVANLIAYKGHLGLVDALAMLAAPPPMCLVGDGPEREHIVARIRARGLADVVSLAGAVPDAARLLMSYQFAVLPSHQEGVPNSVLEAMAAGLPVIATSVGGVPEIVTDGVTGMLVPPRRPDRLAAAIACVAADPGLRVRMGTAARHHVRRFGVETCAARHEAIYRSLLR